MSRKISNSSPKAETTAESFLRNRILPIAMILVVLGFAQAWVQTFYLSNPYIERIGWLARDGEWPDKFGVGIHFFSDYLIMNQFSESSNPWAENNPYPPFSMAIFKLFTIFPYHFGLALWLLLGAICLLAPVLHATKKFSLSSRILILTLLVILTAPFVGTIDRGNSIFLLVPLLYFGYILVEKDRSVIAGILIGAACAIKLYPLLIVLFFLIKRKWKVSGVSIVTFVSISFLSGLLWGNPVDAIRETIANANSYNGLSIDGQPMVFSFAGAVNNVVIFLGLGNTDAASLLQNNSRLFGLALLATLLLVAMGVGLLETFLLSSTTIQLISTVSFTYTRIWTFIAIPLMILNHEKLNRHKDKGSSPLKWWWLFVLSTNSLLVVHFFTPMSLGTVIGVIALVMILFNYMNPKLILEEWKSLLPMKLFIKSKETTSK